MKNELTEAQILIYLLYGLYVAQQLFEWAYKLEMNKVKK